MMKIIKLFHQIDNKNNPKYKNEILENEKIEKNLKKNMLEILSFKAKEVELYGKEALNENLIFNEEENLMNNIELFKNYQKWNKLNLFSIKRIKNFMLLKTQLYLENQYLLLNKRNI